MVFLVPLVLPVGWLLAQVIHRLGCGHTNKQTKNKQTSIHPSIHPSTQDDYCSPALRGVCVILPSVKNVGAFLPHQIRSGVVSRLSHSEFGASYGHLPWSSAEPVSRPPPRLLTAPSIPNTWAASPLRPVRLWPDHFFADRSPANTRRTALSACAK